MMSTVKLYSVPSASDLLQYIEEDVLSLWTVGFFSHYLSVLSVGEAKYPIVQLLSECNTNSWFCDQAICS